MKKAVICGIILLFVSYSVFSSDWNIVLLDTARNVPYLTDVEKDVMLELNKARNNPGQYARLYIEPRLSWFGGPFGNDSYLRPGDTVYISQTGGRAAVVATINALSRLPSLQPLTPMRGMCLAARDHTLDTGPRGIIGHTGSDRSSLNQRLERYGRWNGRIGETISYGFNEAQEIVIQLLISQGHRDIIMTGSHRYAGLSIGAHSQYNHMCTIKFANGFTDR